MFEGYPLIKRVAAGKTVGFLVGLVGFLLMPVLWPETDMMFRLAVLFWYTTFGAIISLFGMITFHPILNLRMPWWFICSYSGAWLDLVLMMFIYDDLVAMMQVWPGEGSLWANPWWLVLEGAIVGWVVGFFTHTPSGLQVDKTV